MELYYGWAWIGCVLVFDIIWAVSPHSYVPTSTSSSNKQRVLGPCQSCKVLISSFQNGLDRTAANSQTPPPLSSSGGTPKVANSTVEGPSPPSTTMSLAQVWDGTRFDDIIKHLCTDVKTGKEQCGQLVIAHSNLLQEYWQNSQAQHSQPDLFTWLCIDKLKVCCPVNHFGPHCTPCPGYPNDICSGHGKCKGNGTRKGNGACNCDNGYEGPRCNSCSKYFYEAYRDETKLICSLCHRSCTGGCSGAGPKNCDACHEGWENDEEKGCLDVNECLMIENSCTKNEFCVNTEGSYACFECDKSCNGCFGDGPDMCEKCNEPAYSLIDKLCIDNSSRARDRKIDVARYLTYFGLCVSTCIIFQKNMAIASVIGVVVGMYIATSEYLLSEQPTGILIN